MTGMGENNQWGSGRQAAATEGSMASIEEERKAVCVWPEGILSAQQANERRETCLQPKGRKWRKGRGRNGSQQYYSWKPNPKQAVWLRNMYSQRGQKAQWSMVYERRRRGKANISILSLYMRHIQEEKLKWRKPYEEMKRKWPHSQWQTEEEASK